MVTCIVSNKIWHTSKIYICFLRDILIVSTLSVVLLDDFLFITIDLNFVRLCPFLSYYISPYPKFVQKQTVLQLVKKFPVL